MIYSINEGIIFSTSKSRGKVINDYNNIEKAINFNTEMLEKSIKLLNEFLDLVIKSDNNPKDSTAMTIMADDLVNKLLRIDYDRASESEFKEIGRSYTRKNYHKISNRADMKNQEVSDVAKKLIEKCSKGGEYRDRLYKVEEEYNKININSQREYDKIKNKDLNDNQKYIWSKYIKEFNWFNNQLKLTIGDVDFVSFKEFTIFRNVELV